MLYYNMQVNTLNNDKDALANYKNQLETWLAGNVTQLQNQIGSQNNALDSLRNPWLIGVISAEDQRPWYGQSSLHVYGPVVNVGANSANNAVLYVEAFQGAVLAFNTTISLGTINGRSFANYVDATIAYNGYRLTKWHVWSQPSGIDWTWTA
jgi:hypothetical protein